LVPFRVQVRETDLYIRAHQHLAREATQAVLNVRYALEEYIANTPRFLDSLTPCPMDHRAPAVVKEMLQASQKVGIGPMAAVAGAIAESVANALLAWTPEIIVENGGDVFLATALEQTVAIFAGPSPLSMKIGVRIPPDRTPLAICTSSSSVGHSHSFGRADAVCVIASSGALADAAATSLGNRVGHKSTIQKVLVEAQDIDGLQGIVIIVGDTVGAWGGYDLVPLR
jgi:hypothetical protein